MTVKTRLCIQFESAQLTKITSSRISYNIQTLIKFNLKMNECKSDYFVDKYTLHSVRQVGNWEMKAKPRASSSACLTALPNIINLTHSTLGMRLWWLWSFWIYRLFMRYNFYKWIEQIQIELILLLTIFYFKWNDGKKLEMWFDPAIYKIPYSTLFIFPLSTDA